MRRTFASELVKQAKLNPKIWLVTADLGMGMWDEFRDTYPDRFLNGGAAEQACADICVGLALEGKIPFFYSITSFALYRPFETWRTYVNHENIPVKIIGGGRDKDYTHDGISHWSEDAWKLFDGTHQEGILNNIKAYWPETKEEIPSILDKMLKSNLPDFVSLRR